jgi:hypothetical protein
MSGELSWFAAADILQMTPRNRRWRERYERWGYNGLVDKRRCPSKRRVPMAQLEQVLRLYRERYAGFNGRHFHEIARREHGITLSYSYVKQALQHAGLLSKRRARGRHRRRREPRACYGELLHLDGSRHGWLALDPDWRGTLITVVDDATKTVLYAQLWEQETLQAVMSALAEVFRREGLPLALDTVVVGGHLLQIERQPGRRTCAGLRVLVRQHLDGRLTLTRPPNVPLRYTVVTRAPATPLPVPRSLPRRRRKTGLGRWPTAEQLWPNL